MIITDKQKIADDYIRIFKMREGVMVDYADLERVVEIFNLVCLVECLCSEEGTKELVEDLQQFNPSKRLMFVVKIDIDAADECANRLYLDVMSAIICHNERHDYLFAGFDGETQSNKIRLFVFDSQKEEEDNYYYEQLTKFMERITAEASNILHMPDFEELKQKKVNMSDLVKSSKRLSYLLRHTSLPNANGWVSLDVLEDQYGLSADLVQKIVDRDTKGRFEYCDDGRIRALYGHSNNVQIVRIPARPPEVLFHGTASKYISRICAEGLRPRSRNFVHLSSNKDSAVEVGTRHGDVVLLSVNATEMYNDGYPFYYVATSAIWLVADIPVKYLKIVEL